MQDAAASRNRRREFRFQCALSGSGTHDVRRDDLLYELSLAQAIQSGRGEDDRVVLACFEFAQASIHIAAQRMDIEIGADALSAAPGGAGSTGADFRALRKIVDACVFFRTKHIAAYFRAW